MTIDGNFKYFRALVLSAERLSDLIKVLEVYCEKINYEAVTINNLNIAFQSKDELLAYDNYAKKRIKE